MADRDVAPVMPAPPPVPSAPPADAPPNWSAYPDDVLCPLCDYNLRGLTEPRCPECGYAFTWPALFAARRGTHPYLFEHHPRRNAWSYLRTLRGNLLPNRFWTRLSAAHEVRVGRLVIYWVIALLAAILSVAIYVGPEFASQVRQYQRWRASYIAQLNSPQVKFPPGQTARQVAYDWFPPAYTPRGFHNVARSTDHNLLPALALFTAWPWATWVILLLFRQSMRQARVRPVQILRCTLYSADAGAAALGVALSIAVAAGLYAWLPQGMFPNLESGLLPMALAACLVATYRLSVAYARYLRFRHPRSTVLATQVILFLIAFNLYLPWVTY